MKKYLYGFQLFFLDAFHYRFNAVVQLFFGNVSTVVTVLFWVLIYRSNGAGDINGFSLSDMVAYYIVSSIVRGGVFSNSGFHYAGLIKEGKLNSELLKPYSINASLYFRNLAGYITGTFPQFVLVVLLLPVLARAGVSVLQVRNLLLLLAFMVLSTISSHMVWSILGLMAFWLEEVHAVMWSFAVLFNMISGMFLPLDFFPQAFLSVIRWLPFSCWTYLPTKVYLGLTTPEETALLLGVNVAWIAVLWGLQRIVWGAGVRRYASVGG